MAVLRQERRNYVKEQVQEIPSESELTTKPPEVVFKKKIEIEAIWMRK